MFYWSLKIFFGWIVWIIWIKKINGLENIPRSGPYIIASNHSSYFDFISLISIWPHRIYFLAGEVFFEKWWWYPFVKFTNQIKVDRRAKNKEEAKQKTLNLLKKGKVVGIFPEGTRSPDGSLGVFYPGVGEFAVKANVKVIPVGIKGAYEVMSRYDKYPKLKKNIEIVIGKPLFFNNFPRNQQNNKNLFEEITNKVRDEIKKLISL